MQIANRMRNHVQVYLFQDALDLATAHKENIANPEENLSSTQLECTLNQADKLVNWKANHAAGEVPTSLISESFEPDDVV